MSKLAEQLRAIKVFNNWEILTRFGDSNDVAIEYHCPAEGRAGWCDTHHSSVWSPRANPKLPIPKWLTSVRGDKQFIGLRKTSFYEAITWAEEQFGHKFVPSPFGGHIPTHVLAKAKAAISTAK